LGLVSGWIEGIQWIEVVFKDGKISTAYEDYTIDGTYQEMQNGEVTFTYFSDDPSQPNFPGFITKGTFSGSFSNVQNVVLKECLLVKLYLNAENWIY